MAYGTSLVLLESAKKKIDNLPVGQREYIINEKPRI